MLPPLRPFREQARQRQRARTCGRGRKSSLRPRPLIPSGHGDHGTVLAGTVKNDDDGVRAAPIQVLHAGWQFCGVRSEALLEAADCRQLIRVSQRIPISYGRHHDISRS